MLYGPKGSEKAIMAGREAEGLVEEFAKLSRRMLKRSQSAEGWS